MKKTIIAVVLLAGVVSGYSQGAINFNNNATGFKQKIYNVSTGGTAVVYGGYTTIEVQGSSSTDTPVGSTAYSGAALGGTGFSAELLAGNGTGDALSQLSPVGTVVSFQTATAGAGFLAGGQVVTVASSGTAATIAIAAWNNEGGTITSLLAAQQAGDPWGISALANITGAISPGTPPTMSTATDLNLSFSLGVIPEPSTIALGVMGASTLLFRRRK
jgi:hypothetical protein